MPKGGKASGVDVTEVMISGCEDGGQGMKKEIVQGTERSRVRMLKSLNGGEPYCGGSVTGGGGLRKLTMAMPMAMRMAAER